MDQLAAFAARGDKPIAGSVSVGDGETFDVGAALEEGDGTIVVVADSNLGRALSGFDGLKGASVPAGAVAINAEDEPAPETINASDAAKNKAAELGVDLSKVEGKGKGGAIRVEDVEAHAAGGEGSGEGDS